MKNYYEILEVNKKASIDVIEKAYKVLIDKYKPEKYQGEERTYAEKKKNDLNEAYHVLTDYFLREQYDLELEKEENTKYNVKNSKNSINNNQKQNKKKTYERQNIKRVKEKSKNEKNKTKETEIGTFKSLFALIKEVFEPFKIKDINIKKVQKIDKTTWISVGLTILILLLIGGILWAIPFTRPWLKGFLFIK